MGAAHRRVEQSLSDHREFDVLSLTAHPLLRTPGSARRSRLRYTLTGPAAGRVAAARRLLTVLTYA